MSSHAHLIKQRRLALHNSLNRISDLELQLRWNPTNKSISTDLQTEKHIVNDILDKECKRLALKLHQIYYEGDNKCSKIFARKLKRRTNWSYILSLKSLHNTTHNDTITIAETFRRYYQTLYNLPDALSSTPQGNSEHSTHPIEFYLLDIPIPKISLEQRNLLDSPF